MNGKDGAQDGPTFTGNQRPVGGSWWNIGWENEAPGIGAGGGNPEGNQDAWGAGNYRPLQQAITDQLLFKPVAGPTPAPIPTPSPAPTPTPAPSQGSYITPGKGSFTDAAGNVYGLDAMGNADENGTPVADGSNTAAMQYANGQVYGQDAASHSWYTWNQTTWTAASAPPRPRRHRPPSWRPAPTTSPSPS